MLVGTSQPNNFWSVALKDSELVEISIESYDCITLLFGKVENILIFTIVKSYVGNVYTMFKARA